MFHVQDVLVPDCEEEQDGQDGATDEGNVPGDDSGEGGDEYVHIIGGGAVCPGQSGCQFVLQLIKMSEREDYQLSR